MPALSIRSATANDLEQLNQMMFELHQEHHQRCPEHFKSAEEIEQEKSIARYLDNPDCLVLVATKGQMVLGFVTGHFCELVSSVSQPVQMGSIDELYVLVSERQNGIASKLIRELEQRFNDYGVKQMFVEVWHFNQQAVQFYHQAGFEHHIHWLRKAITSNEIE
ncbi:GNAT family N-acetyltransferase [Vibrio sinaloensis]|uniref:GNAT family N-acetyltransferase n=1 Tax=Photobacterium sp. (strain ATCC 43367) TaxID=379097 RepID=UPI0020586140|nr:GNAT family N-acetyltransferase [Vibrio sinaloensis]UPQ86828.1 GNAT family N-acetyltransferase [Vibrio sinaloensis]